MHLRKTNYPERHENCVNLLLLSRLIENLPMGVKMGVKCYQLFEAVFFSTADALLVVVTECKCYD